MLRGKWSREIKLQFSWCILIRYLMSTERMRYADALEYVRLLRPDVRPNDGFQRQLKAYDTSARHCMTPTTAARTP